MIAGDPPAVLVATLAVVVVTGLRPRWGIALLLVGLPFFAHHPATPLARSLVALAAVAQGVYVLRVRPSPARAWRAMATQPLLLLGALFVAAAFLSLSSLPLAGIWHEYRAAPDTSHLADWPRLVTDWMRHGEARREFPLTSAGLTLQGFVLALMVWRETASSSAAAIRLATVITVGMLVFLALGLLETFDVASLQALRGTALVEAPPGTLQSTAGNPGWFSQYLVYALPYALVVLVRPSAPAWRAGWLIGVSALAAFGLVLSWRRGGWISGAIVMLYMTLVGAWLAREAGPAARPRIGRAVAAVGVLVLLVAGGYAFWLQARSADAQLAAPGFVSRLQSITAEDRLPFFAVGWKIAGLHPVLGGGHESFAHLYDKYFQQADGLYHAEPPLVQGASAHNVYIQTLAGTGVVGFLLLAAIFGVAALSVVRGLRAPGSDRARTVALVASGGSLLGVACYGMVQEVFYVHALRLLFFTGLGMLAGVTAGHVKWPRRTGPLLWLALGAAFVVHLGYEYWWPGPERLLPAGTTTGLHAVERGPDDTPFRWSTEWATWPLPAGVTAYSLQVRSLAPFAQEVQVEACGSVSTRIVLRDHAWHAVDGQVEDCAAAGHLQLRVSPSWRPPADGRLLGVMTANVRFR